MIEGGASVIVAIITAIIGPAILHALSRRTDRKREEQSRIREHLLAEKIDSVARDAGETRDHVANSHATKFRDDFDALVGQVSGLTGLVAGLSRRLDRNDQHFRDLHGEDEAIENTLSSKIVRLTREMKEQRENLDALTHEVRALGALRSLIINPPVGAHVPAPHPPQGRSPL